MRKCGRDSERREGERRDSGRRELKTELKGERSEGRYRVRGERL